MSSQPSLETERIVARFLDSSEARGLGVPIAELRRFALLFVATALDDLGVEPRLLDEQTLSDAIDRTARKLGRGDAVAKDGGRVLRALYDHLKDTEVVPNAYEIEKSLDGIEARFPRLAAAVADADRIAGETRRIENRAAKVGRNEPCPCGSGKKFKQCCGRVN